MNSFPAVITLLGVVTTPLYIPMILGKVPPNRFYGIRTPAAFASDENWYRINKAGGKALLPSSILMTIVGLVGYLIPADDFAFYEITGAIILLISVIASSWLLLRSVRGR